MSDSWEELVDKPMPRFDLEIPVAGRTWMLEHDEQPETFLQALMETPPGGTQRESKEEQRHHIHHIYYVVENELSDEERAVLECTVIAGHSIRDAAKLLGWPKSTVHRIKQSALERMKRILEGEEYD